ncbi:GSCFA domain-containing protein [Allorhizobium pseudoryzae]|uniref:GSCFA domain-containing protein n=1 Tax=Allorhizobium pseudoryzae TaxID=379684 RepID=UPI003D047E35
MTNPYSKSKPYQMWRRSVTRVEPHLLDPVVNPRFKISKQTRVGTAGSCFAQHIAKKIASIGFNYFIPEAGDNLPEMERRSRQFGVYSARYGNLYTVAQLLQLYEEAFEGRDLSEKAWRRPDGRYVDPYRPQVEPAGYETLEGVVAARRCHMESVRRVFEESEIFIFTLGLTESWRSCIDGAIFPLAPGVVAGDFDPAIHEFHNYSVSETSDLLRRTLEKIRSVNAMVKILLTVSPVPLIATYEDRHVLASTTYSKSILRVAAQECVDQLDWVDYFPSYEIMTSSSTGGMYYEDDFREIAPRGVAHAMRCFVRNYVEGADKARPEYPGYYMDQSRQSTTTKAPSLICDEEAIDVVNV